MAKHSRADKPVHPDAQVLRGADLLSTAQAIIQNLIEDDGAALVAQCGSELTKAVKVLKAGTAADKVLNSLTPDAKSERGLAPTLASFLDAVTRNTYDDKMTNLNRTKVTDEQRQVHQRHKALQLTNLASVISRIRSQHALPVDSIRRALEYRYIGMPRHLWMIGRAYREVPGERWTDQTLAAAPVRAWRPPAQEKLSKTIDLCCRDNLEWWRSVSYSRHSDGVKKESELIHTVTGEHFHIPASLVDHLPDPKLGIEWPFLGEYNYSDAIVTDAEMQVFLEPLWGKICCLQAKNIMQLLMRPPPIADRVKWEAPTPLWHPPVILNCGTSSYIDNVKIVKNVRENRLAEKSIIACDMQTFCRLWWLKKKAPAQFEDMVPWAGEFHGLAHLVDGIVILDWAYILEPILLHFDVAGFHLKLNMKETSQRIRWIILILCAGQTWMKQVFDASDLANIPALLVKVKGNIPVWAFIGFLYYHAAMIWGVKEAIQTTDTHMLDYMWRFSLRVYAHTNKTNYKKGCVQNSKVLFDCEERVKQVIRHHRTCNDSGRACAGCALDYRNEKVVHYCMSIV